MNEPVPNFDRATETANEILVCSNTINAFPFSSPALIMEMSDIALRSYGTLRGDIAPATLLGSEDAAIVEGNGRYIIFYNELMPATRVQFSLTHEFGHYMLNHDMVTIIGARCDKDADFLQQYGISEVEAHCFAAQLLMPEQILRECIKRGIRITEQFLMNAFGVSYEAAQKRMQTLRKRHNPLLYANGMSYDDIILKKFTLFIDKITPRSYEYAYDLEADIAMEKERQSWM